MQPSKIEWLKNPIDGSKGYSCNPVKGICKMGCPYCYAIRIYKRFKWNHEIQFDYSELDRINKIKIVRDGGYWYPKIFMGSTHDIFGDWIPDDWIKSIILKAVQNPKIIFIFLTKNPKRYSEFDFPKNAWIGYSTTGNLFHKWDERHSDNIKFVSLEPMQHGIDANLEGYAQRIDFQWLIIGQETRNRKEKHIVTSTELISMIEFARKANIPIFVKNNLKIHFNEMSISMLKKCPQEYPKVRERI